MTSGTLRRFRIQSDSEPDMFAFLDAIAAYVRQHPATICRTLFERSKLRGRCDMLTIETDIPATELNRLVEAIVANVDWIAP